MDQRIFEEAVTAVAAKGPPTILSAPTGLKDRLAYLAALLRNDSYDGNHRRLFWRSDRGAVMSLPLTTPLVVGRDASANIIVSDARISRSHCIISSDIGGDYVEDLRSTNGTKVNGEVIAGKRYLFDGDFIDAAGFLVVYVGR